MKKNNSFKTLVEKTKSAVSQLQKKIDRLSNTGDETKEKNYLQLLKSIKHPNIQLVDISARSVARATLVIILLCVTSWVTWLIRDILLLIFVAFFLSSALDPTVNYLKSKKIPRSLGLIFIYALIFGVLILFLSNLAPLIATQILELAAKVKDIVTNFSKEDPETSIPFLSQLKPMINQIMEAVDRETIVNSISTALKEIGSRLQGFAGNAFRAIAALFQGVANTVLVLVLTFYMTINEKGIENFIISLFPSRHSAYIMSKSSDIKNKIGHWLRGQILLALAIGVITFIGLKIIGVEFALTLAMIAGLLEFIPVIGPLLSFIIAVPIALNQEPILVVWVAIMFFIIQQLENNLLVPVIMRKSVGLSPIIIIISMLIGYRFLGILGIILSVPLATIISIFVKDYTAKAK